MLFGTVIAFPKLRSTSALSQMIVTMLEWMDACLNIPCTAPSNVSVEFAWDTIQQIVAHDYLDNNIYNILVLT